MASLSNSGLAHPPRSIPGSCFSFRPPFACITPSTETCVLVVSFIGHSSLLAEQVSGERGRTARPSAARLLSYNHMVVRRKAGEEKADLIFRALADRTRRDIVRQAMSGTLSVSALARRYPMSTTAVQKHVAILEEAGLVHQTRRGRENLVQTEIDAIGKA